MNRLGSTRWAAVLAVMAAALFARGAAAAPGGAALYRVVLTDGTALVSYGEFARVGDRVVFSMPVGADASPRLQLVNLPAKAVNWETTERYAEATRYAQYVDTRAEADFAVLTGQVAEALREISLATDPQRKIQIAAQTRRSLVAWPAEHFGYRSRDIREMDTLLEETIAQLRASTGQPQFDLSLVAMIEPPTMPLLPDPTPEQRIDQLFRAARLADVPAERLGLLRAVIEAIDAGGGQLSRDWAATTREAARATLDAETAIERKYHDLAHTALDRAQSAAAAADVRRVERIMADVRKRDDRLGKKRSDEVAALLAALQDRLDSARRLRLMRDQWTMRAAAYKSYRAAVSGPIDQLSRLGPRLEDIRKLAGPNVGLLPGIIQRCESISRQLALVQPPAEMAAAHATLVSAVDLAQQAARRREQATVTGDVRAAWDASAAASGSMLMLAQARKQMDAVARPPELQ
jgi:hypothetical protein